VRQLRFDVQCFNGGALSNADRGPDAAWHGSEAEEAGRWSGNYPPDSPAEWRAEGHVSCSVGCLNGDCKDLVDVRLETLPRNSLGRASAPSYSATKAERRTQ
jgi:hypothetical protein